MTDDDGLLRVITSANIACGFHAGDPDRMMVAMRGAVGAGVGIGAHPGFDDLRRFGRNRMDVPRATLENQIRYKVAASAGLFHGGAVCRADGRLVDRRDPGAVIHDAGQAAAGVLAILRAGAIPPAAGDPIPTRIDTVCVHGDSPGAVAMAQGLRLALQGAGGSVARFG
jgi:lactam utilization protein B